MMRMAKRGNVTAITIVALTGYANVPLAQVVEDSSDRGDSMANTVFVIFDSFHYSPQ